VGRLQVDHPVPFLCVYRAPPEPDAGTASLVDAEASYLHLYPNADKRARGVVRTVLEALHTRFGAVLVVEVWAERMRGVEAAAGHVTPTFTLHCSQKDAPVFAVNRLQTALGAVRLRKRRAEAVRVELKEVAPPEMAPILTAREARALGCHVLGLEVKPVYRGADRQLFPGVSEGEAVNVGLILGVEVGVAVSVAV
jgi:hypothetical protein